MGVLRVRIGWEAGITWSPRAKPICLLPPLLGTRPPRSSRRWTASAVLIPTLGGAYGQRLLPFRLVRFRRAATAQIAKPFVNISGSASPGPLCACGTLRAMLPLSKPLPPGSTLRVRSLTGYREEADWQRAHETGHKTRWPVLHTSLAVEAVVVFTKLAQPPEIPRQQLSIPFRHFIVRQNLLHASDHPVECGLIIAVGIHFAL